MLAKYLLLAGVVTVAALGCGDAFTSSGAGSGGSGNTGGFGGGATSGGAQVGGSSGAACNAGVLVNGGDVKLFTTLDSDQEIAQPLLPANGAGMVGDTDFVEGLNGNGVKLDGEGARFFYAGAGDYFKAIEGTIDFCIKPLHHATEGRTRYFLSVRDHEYEWASLLKTEKGSLEFRLGSMPTGDGGLLVGTLPDPPFTKDRWYRLTVAWSMPGAIVSMYLDGEPLSIVIESTALVMPGLSPDAQLIVGDLANGDGKDLSPNSVLDELYILGVAATPVAD